MSLLPAATEIVVALGALDALCGVTHECDFPPEVARLRRVTSSAVDGRASSAAIDGQVSALAAGGEPMFRLDTVALEQLAPTVVLTQALCDVCALSETDVRRAAAALTPSPTVVSLGGASLAGVWEDVRRVGAAIGREADAVELLAHLDTRLQLVHERLKAARAPRPRVAVIEWLDPLYAAGHWTPELVRRAGGVDVLATPGAHSVPISLDTLRDASPDVLLFAPCGFDVERAEREARALLGSAGWEWTRACRAWALDGNALTSRPGPRLADAVEVMSAAFAPGLFPAPSDRYARQLSR